MGAHAYNAKLRPMQLRLQKADWRVLIPDVHDGYISWQNATKSGSCTTPAGSPRRARTYASSGSALLQGRWLCGRCSPRIRVHYELLGGHLRPYYVCNEDAVRHAGKHLHGFTAPR
jgi:hypothetical protein